MLEENLLDPTQLANLRYPVVLVPATTSSTPPLVSILGRSSGSNLLRLDLDITTSTDSSASSPRRVIPVPIEVNLSGEIEAMTVSGSRDSFLVHGESSLGQVWGDGGGGTSARFSIMKELIDGAKAVVWRTGEAPTLSRSRT